MRRELDKDNWEQHLGEQIDRIAAEPEELMRYELMDSLFDDILELMKDAYTRGRTYVERNGDDE